MEPKKERQSIEKIAQEIVEGFEVDSTTAAKQVEELFDWEELQEKYKLEYHDLEIVKIKVIFLIEVMIQENQL